MNIQKGSIIEGKVKNITKYGAFVELPDGNVGLVHISEVDDNFVDNIRDYLKEEQLVKVKVLDVSENGQKISLSIKKAKTNMQNRPKKSKDNEFENKLMKFLKESDERLNDFKKRYDNKRRG